MPELESAAMPYATLGRTGLRVSRAGLGGGGHSRLGQARGKSVAHSIAVVRRALELGVNFIDTAEVYGTEPIIAKAIRHVPRDGLVLSTKRNPYVRGWPAGLVRRLRGRRPLIRPRTLTTALEASLRRLNTEHLDVYHLHGLRAPEYDRAIDTLLPAMERAKRQGKVRALGVTELFEQDPGHAMLQRAVNDAHFYVVMVGFNILNPGARRRILATTQRKGIGVLNMFAVRRAMSDHARLRAIVRELADRGEIDSEAIDLADPLGWLVTGAPGDGGGSGRGGPNAEAESLPDAAYRFCRHEPGVDVVLFGTGELAHVDANVRSILRPPLSEAAQRRLEALFGHVDGVSGQ